MKKGIFLAALSGTLYGCLGYFGHELKASGLSILQICLWRFLFSTLCFVPILPLLFKEKIRWKALRLPFFMGAIFYSASTYFYFLACPYTGSGLAMIIFFTYPILVILISSALHKTRPGGVILLSSFLILVGCLLIAMQSSMHFDYFGVLLAILSALAYAIYVAMSKNVGEPIPPLQATFAVCLGNIAAYILILPLTDSSFVIPWNAHVLSQLALFGFFGTFLPVLLLLLSLKSISPNTAAIISVSEPVTSLTVGFFVLGEHVSLIQFLGALIILSGALLTTVFVEDGH